MSLQYPHGMHSLVYVAMPSESKAKEMTNTILERELAIGVNIIRGIITISKVEEDSDGDGDRMEEPEVMMMIKTLTSRVVDLIEHIESLHPYNVGDVIAVPITNGSPEYLSRVSQGVMK